MRTLPPDPHAEQLAALRVALTREQGRVTALKHRAALLEGALKRAYRMAFDGRPRRRDEPEPE